VSEHRSIPKNLLGLLPVRHPSMNTPNDILVVKIGGSVGQQIEHFCRDAAALIIGGARLVVVHGGSEHTNALAERLGHPAHFITSPSGHTSRRTDLRTIEIMQMACRGLLNQQIVRSLQNHGVNAVGVSGMDGRTWQAERKAAVRAVIDGRITVIRDDYTGSIETINPELIRVLLNTGFTPVLSPPAIGREHEPLNVDADRAAAKTAKALGARELVLLTNVPGLLARFPDENTLIPRIVRASFANAESAARGRMKKKVLGAVEALDGGVRRVIIGDARVENPIRRALDGAGTVFE